MTFFMFDQSHQSSGSASSCKPISKMRAFLSHPLNTHSMRRERTFDDLSVGRIDIDYSLRRRCFGIIVDVLGSWKGVANSMKAVGKARLADRLSKGNRIAEE